MDTLPEIVMHLLFNRILEAELQYVSYATTSDIQKSIVEWIETLKIEGTMEESSKIEGMMEEMLGMIEGTIELSFCMMLNDMNPFKLLS